MVALLLGLRLTAAPRRAVRLGWLLLALIGLQGVIGYTQYFTGLPAGLVWVHVTGSVGHLDHRAAAAVLAARPRAIGDAVRSLSPASIA